jgi:hypothetical protein
VLRTAGAVHPDWLGVLVLDLNDPLSIQVTTAADEVEAEARMDLLTRYWAVPICSGVAHPVPSNVVTITVSFPPTVVAQAAITAPEGATSIETS